MNKNENQIYDIYKLKYLLSKSLNFKFDDLSMVYDYNDGRTVMSFEINIYKSINEDFNKLYLKLKELDIGLNYVDIKNDVLRLHFRLKNGIQLDNLYKFFEKIIKIENIIDE